jgi:hypothetical protein|nr:MAG TPA: hypothetical protein [Caudoviricetes sp.]DAX27924.1 MAG TPA: hypothetical protein [Caudoviricetes sp.]
MKAPDSVKQFAKKHWGTDEVLYEKQWRGYDVFSPVFPDGAILGTPQLIFLQDRRPRAATVDEAFEYLDEYEEGATEADL